METLERTDVPAYALFSLIVAGWTSQMLAVVARLGIADLLSDGPRRTSELAEACGARRWTRANICNNELLAFI